MATATVRPKAKARFDGEVASNDGNIAVVKYKDGESRVFQNWDWKPGAKEQFQKEMPVGARIRWDWRPSMRYGMCASAEGPGATSKVMTVGDLIRELQELPSDAVALISSDEEGNMFKHLYNLTDGALDEEDASDERYEGHGLKVGDKYVIIWPHG